MYQNEIIIMNTDFITKIDIIRDIIPNIDELYIEAGNKIECKFSPNDWIFIPKLTNERCTFEWKYNTVIKTIIFENILKINNILNHMNHIRGYL